MINKWPEPNPRIPQSFSSNHVRRADWKNYIKKLVYPFYLPFESMLALWKANLLGFFDPRIFIVGGRGSEYDFMISHLGYHQIHKKRILLQGVGSTLEYGFWTPYQPSLIIGTDLNPEWDSRMSSSATTSLHLISCDLGSLPFESDSFDGAGSINAFEHFRNLEVVLAETARVLRKGTWFLATFTPLYYAIGGDHLSFLRGGIQNGFNHILLDTEEYKEFVNAMTIQEVDIKDSQPDGGLSYIIHDLFSRRTFVEYKAAFQKYFYIRYLRGHIDPEGLKFRKKYPDLYRNLLTRGYKEQDLLVSGISIIGEKKG